MSSNYDPNAVPQQTDLLSSPLAQLLVPLAAVAASAVSPRYGAPAAQAGLGALGAMQNYKVQGARIQDLLQAQQREKQRTQDFHQMLAQYGTDGTSSAPNGGNAPAATLQAQSNALDTVAPGGTDTPGPKVTAAPKVHGTLDPMTLKSLELMGPEAGSKRLSELLQKQEPQPKLPDYQKAGERTFGGYRSETLYDKNSGKTLEVAMGPEDQEAPKPADRLHQVLDTLRIKNPNATIIDAIRADAAAGQAPERPQQPTQMSAEDAAWMRDHKGATIDDLWKAKNAVHQNVTINAKNADDIANIDNMIDLANTARTFAAPVAARYKPGALGEFEGKLAGVWNRGKYKAMGGTSDEDYQNLISSVETFKANALGPLMKSAGRNQKVLSLIQQHMPNSTDAPNYIIQKLDFMDNLFRNLRARKAAAAGLEQRPEDSSLPKVPGLNAEELDQTFGPVGQRAAGGQPQPGNRVLKYNPQTGQVE